MTENDKCKPVTVRQFALKSYSITSLFVVRDSTNFHEESKIYYKGHPLDVPPDIAEMLVEQYTITPERHIILFV